MPLLFGPKNSRYTDTGSTCPHNDLALHTEAKTLGEAIRDYENAFDVVVTPCLEPLPGQAEVKYFTVIDRDTEIMNVVDIHIFRGESEICPKQDTSFILHTDDLVEMGELIC